MIKKLLPKGEFGKNVITLMTGTAIAQALPIAISPILTRIYTPNDFGVFALYMSIVGIIAAIATGRYEMAIMLPEDKIEVNAIVKLIIYIVSIFITAISVSILLFNKQIANILGNPEIAPWLYFLPISILLSVIYQVVNYLLIREKQFKQLSQNKILASTTNGSIQLTSGFISPTPLGFILGSISSYILSLGVILNKKLLSDYFKKPVHNINDIAKKYSNFPKYDVPAVLTNLLANQLPLFALSRLFGAHILGFYSLMYKVLMTPLNLISNSILDVYKQKATEDYNKTGTCTPIFKTTVKKLAILGLIPTLILLAFAPQLFIFVFGKNWATAGHFAQIMAPMFYLNFIINPISYTFFIVQKQKHNLYSQIILLLFMILSIYIGSVMNNVEVMIYSLSISYCFIYIYFLILSYIFSKGTKND